MEVHSFSSGTRSIARMRHRSLRKGEAGSLTSSAAQCIKTLPSHYQLSVLVRQEPDHGSLTAVTKCEADNICVCADTLRFEEGK